MEKARAYALGMFPIIKWTENYSSSDFLRDFIGGLQLSTILIPQAMSYSLIACLPAEYGLYSVVISGIMHVFFGKSPYESLGPFAVTSLITGGALLTAAVDLQEQLTVLQILPSQDIFQSLESLDPWIEYPIIIPLSEIFTFLISITLLLIFVTNAGKLLAKFLPKELIAGFTSAAAISIVISQLKQLLGISIPTVKGSFVNFKALYYLASQITQINWISLSMGLATALVIIACQFIEENLTASTFGWTTNEGDQTPLLKPGTIPAMLMSIVIPTFISYLADLPKLHLKIIGVVPRGLPTFNLPWRVLSLVPESKIWIIFIDLIPNVLAVSLVSYVALLSILQEFPLEKEEEIVINGADTAADNRENSDRQAENVENVSEERAEEDPELGPAVLVPNTDEDVLLPSSAISFSWSIEDNELLSLVLANFFVPFASGYVVSPSLSRSAILATQLRTKTPLGNFVGCGMIMVTCFALTDLIYQIPLACLSGLVIISLKSTLMKITTGYKLYLKGGIEFKIWLVTFLTVVIIDPATGIMVGIATCAFLNYFIQSSSVS